MKVMDVRRLLADMCSSDPRVVKGGIQAACELIEIGKLSARTRINISRALSSQLGSSDVNVRRWTYKLIALLGDPAYIAYLVRQLSDVDPVPENRTWAVAALACLDRDFLKTLYGVGEQLTCPYALAASMYGDNSNVASAIRSASNDDDPLGHQWIGLLYGEGRAPVDRALLSELTSSTTPEVVEYIIWGIRLRREYGVEDIRIDPLALPDQAVNVRRWYYRTVAQDAKARNAYAAQVIDWIEHESDSKAREGLARGLHESVKDWFWRDVEWQWRGAERDPFVLRALGVPLSTIDLAKPSQPLWTPRTLQIDRPLEHLRLPSITPHRKERLIMYTDNRVSINHNSGQVVAAHGSMHVHQPIARIEDPETGRLLQRLAERLRESVEGDVPAGIVAEIDALVVEQGKIAARKSTESCRSRFVERLRALTQGVRAAGAAVAATDDLVQQLENVAHNVIR